MTWSSSVRARVAGTPPRAILAASALVAAVATAGSLTFSIGLGLVPCQLCWYQRILMYPLVVVLGVAALEDRAGVYRTVLPLAVGGLAIAVYHSYLQYEASTAPPGTVTCSFGGCGAIQYTVAGLTIPNLSAIAFGLIVVGTVWVAARDRGSR